MSTKKVRAKYRKVHVPMKHKTVKVLDVMGTHHCGKQHVVATMHIQGVNDVVVYLKVQDMDKLSRKALRRATERYAQRFFEDPQVKILRYGVG